jgi:hypothetical protein
MELYKKITEEEHVLVLNEKADVHEDGLILGNGDLSVSIYQKEAEIVWRFGKGDVWDRRHMTEEDPSPLTLEELRRGLHDEGWCTGGPLGGKITALHGTKDPKRTCEVLQPAPSRTYPYPNPKPVGELSLHWPADLQGLKITQKLFIKQARVEIYCEWRDGEQLEIKCFVHPVLNLLVVHWKLSNFNWGAPQPFFKEMPIWLSLYRWPDQNYKEFGARWKSQYNTMCFEGISDKAIPLPPPEVIYHNGKPVIQQKFYPDKLFPAGFRYWLGCVTNLPGVERVDTGVLNEARLLISSEPPQTFDELCNGFVEADRRLREGKVDYPPLLDYSGYIAVPVTTSSDEGGCEQEYNRICGLLKDNPEAVFKRWEDENCKTAQKFWSVSSIKIAEKTLEDLWYETLHVCRCIYREGTVPPGLFLPSCINDYSQWNSDYHNNYNFQQCFWGLFTANHAELTEAYFKAMEFIDHIGKKIARDYCGTRGTFVQIVGYPMLLDKDPIPTTPMARMPYMTGWAVDIYWMYYLYSQDMNFLRERAYPFIRDCALFYIDYLDLGKDGLYHAFPSCFGEAGYNGDPEVNKDAPQTMAHADMCLRIALSAAKLLDIDPDLQKAWQERVDKLAPEKGESEWEPLPEASELRQQQYNMPEFRPAEWYRYPRKWSFAKRWWSWVQFLPWGWMRDVRGGQFVPERDFKELLQVINRWRHKNGLLWPMPIRFWGRLGPMTETLGIIAPLQEMLLQSWDKVIRVFPVWPTGVEAGFEQLRAEGAFLISSQFDGKKTVGIKVKSLAGNTCTIANPWQEGLMKLLDLKTGKVIDQTDKETLTFNTRSGEEYQLICGDK